MTIRAHATHTDDEKTMTLQGTLHVHVAKTATTPSYVQHNSRQWPSQGENAAHK